MAMKKTALIFVIVSLLSACTKDITKLNNDPINPSVVPSYSLFTEGERLMANTVVSASSSLNIFRLIEQQWTETQYLTESRYDLRDDGIPDNIWDAFYAGALINLEKAKSTMKLDVKDAGTLKNETAIADICEVYSFYYLITTFGNIPYSEAFNANNTFPKFDDAATVYNELLTRLDADIAAINTSAGSFGSADPLYNGDPAKWLKFANTFKLKMGITIADSDPATSKTVIAAAIAAGVFTSNTDNANYHYISTPPNTNPIWVDLVQSQRFDFVATNKFIGLLKATDNTGLQDPRTPYYFALSKADSVYKGAPNAVTTITAGDYSLPAGPLITPGSTGTLTNPDFPGDLLDYSETAFNLAEAAARGYSVGGSALSYYNKAITASIEYWGGSATQAAAYLQQKNVVFDDSSKANELISIAAQEYLAYYNRGWDEWIVNRRLNYPVLTPPPHAYSAFPVRLLYPVIEQNANGANYKQAAAAIGGDVVTTRLWFDKH
jgi:hypothetical protein